MSQRKCWDCKETKPLAEFHHNKRARDGYHGRCKSCASRYQYLYRQTVRGKEVRSANTRAYAKRNPHKHSVRGQVQRACKKGQLPRVKPCEVCGFENDIHKHHDDYFNPWQVRYLCRKHHIEFHQNQMNHAPVAELERLTEAKK